MGVNEPIEQIRNPQNAGRAAMGTELDGPAESSVNNRLRPASAHYRGLPERRLPKQLRPAQLAAGRPLTHAHLDVRGRCASLAVLDRKDARGRCGNRPGMDRRDSRPAIDAMRRIQ